MTVGELKKLLEEIPDSHQVYYEDGNYGGKAGEFQTNDLTWEPIYNRLLVRSPWWEECD